MTSEDFIHWALDPARTVEERYTTELLVEMGVGWWNSRHKIYDHINIDAQIERKRQRALNPAYDPRYSEEAVRKTAEELPRMATWWSSGGMDDRPVRDLSVFRFLPNLENLSASDIEVTDLSVLADCPKLCKLSLSCRNCEDFRPLARCAHLRELSIAFWRTYYKSVPLWPDFTGLDQLDQLESLTLEGNLLALPRGLVWPKVRRAVLRCLPLAARNLRDLPQLPACEFLTLAGVERLAGIEAFPRLRNLTVETNVRSFAPLTVLKQLTAFTCNAFEPVDVAPLAQLPNLRCATFDARYQFELHATAPRDFSPLGGAPQLRELHVANCPPVELEVAALNATLPTWDDVFLAPQPRPLPALRMVIAPHAKHPGGRGIQLDPDDHGLPDDGLRQCEGNWVARHVEKNVSARLGCSDWGHAGGNGAYRTVEVVVESFAVVEKFRNIVEATRESLAQLRPDYEGAIHVWLKVPKRKPTAAEQQLIDKFQEEQDKAEYERRQREQEAYRERLHELELKKQLGEPIKPEDFAPGEQEPLPPPPWDEEEDEDEDENDSDADEAGDVAVKEKPDPPPMWYDDNEHPLADEYNIMAHLTLEEIWFFSHARDKAIYLMGRQPDLEIPDEKKEP